MATITVSKYKQANDTLRINDLRQGLYDEGAILMDKVLVNLHGDEHRTRRLVESKVFRRDFFRWYEAEVFPKTLKETLAPFQAKGKLDVVDFGFRVMMNLTADFSGVDRPKRTPEETEQLLRILRTFGKAATLGQAKGDKAAIRAEIQAAIDEFDVTFYRSSAERRRGLLARFKKGEIGEDDLPRDILVELLRNEAELPLSHEVLMKEIGFFLLAGAFTSIHSMTHAMHEVFTWMKEHPEDSDLVRKDLSFLQRCMHESMRLHPSSPTAGRRPTCPVHLPTGQDATPDDFVSVDLMAANRDTDVFGPDAAQYNPRRQAPKSTGPYGLSFGMGMHSCIGLNLAAGALPRPDADPKEHQFGTVTLIARALLDAKARPDPSEPGVVDTSTIRNNWAKYPVLLG
ncbi:MAG: cytochrome P450 [Alphaproteobacteria bacterium]|nr:cytochrome P450 [Alphaproteobacteria bacterium]